MAYLVKQISSVVNDAVKDALAKTNGVTTIDTSDFVSLGKAISEYNLYEGFFNSLVNRLAKTVYFVRSYKGARRFVLRDEHEFGAFMQKVYTELPEAVNDPAWDIPNPTDGKYTQHSPYDVENTVTVTGKIFGAQGVWSIEIIRPIEQIKTAFSSQTEMMKFIDAIYTTIENAYTLEEERIIALAVNTAIASSLKGGIKRNLLKEYNTANGLTLTAVQALEDANFLKYATREMNNTIENMRTMSTAFNKGGYATFTRDETLVVEVLSQFASAFDTYLQADTFHNELTKLPNYERVPFWQSSGLSFAFSDVSSIDITNTDLIDSTDESDTGNVSQSGIIAFIHDIENVGAYFGNRSSWEMVNPRDDIVIHGEKARKGYGVDENANAIVFYMDENEE